MKKADFRLIRNSRRQPGKGEARKVAPACPGIKSLALIEYASQINESTNHESRINESRITNFTFSCTNLSKSLDSFLVLHIISELSETGQPGRRNPTAKNRKRPQARPAADEQAITSAKNMQMGVLTSRELRAKIKLLIENGFSASKSIKTE